MRVGVPLGVLGLLLLATVGRVLVPAVAVAQPVVRPGFEDHFSGLLGEAPLPGDWAIESIAIDRSEVRYELRRGPAQATLVLTHRSLAPEAGERPRGSTVAGGYFVRPVLTAGGGEGEAALETLMGAVASRLEGSTEVQPFVYVGGAPPAPDPAVPVVDPEPEEEEVEETPRPLLYGLLALLLGLAFALVGALRARSALRWAELLPWALGGVAVALVVVWTWAADDAFITFRYLDNATHGHGLVFNRGERVQGFTHPAWLLSLLGPAALIGPFDAAMLVGIGCTVAMVLLVLRLGRRLALGPWALGGMLVALFASESFVAFQTSGLESSLAHLLTVALLSAAHRVATERRGGSLLLVLASLLILTRLDLVLVAAPLVLGAARDVGGLRELLRTSRLGAMAGALLLVGWLAFATLYYGFPLPNTFYAKTGGPLPLRRGFDYLVDFAFHETLTAILLVAGLWVTLRWRGGDLSEERWVRRLGIAASVYIAYVVSVGGDYMRGRFLVLPHLLTQVGLFTVLGLRGEARRVFPAVALLGLIAFAFGSRATGGSVINERAFHPTSQIWHVGDGHVRPNPMHVQLPPDPTLGATVMASAFTDDPRLRWIDGYGLTDAFIARCPISEEDPRAGHAERRIPRAYFEARGDVRLLDDGEARLRSGDPNLPAAIAELRGGVRWPRAELERRHEEIRLLTRGALFDPARLALIPRYTFGRAHVEVEGAAYVPPP